MLTKLEKLRKLVAILNLLSIDVIF